MLIKGIVGEICVDIHNYVGFSGVVIAFSQSVLRKSYIKCSHFLGETQTLFLTEKHVYYIYSVHTKRNVRTFTYSHIT